MGSPLVSVCMICYNHDKFIRQAIDSIIHQQTNFNFELIIGEDFSTDETRIICEEFAYKHPNIIKLLPSDKNLGAMTNFIRTLDGCNGKYIAFCEGDDYWIDPLKLQKQVAFLEANLEYSLCFHDAIVFWENKTHPPYYFCSNLTKTTYEVEDVIKRWFIPSASMVFRKDSLLPLPDWFRDVYNGDYAIQLILILKGNFYFINQLMSVYRKNDGAFSATVSSSYVNEKVIQLLNLYNNHTNKKYSELIESKIRELKKHKKIMKIKNVFGRNKFGRNLWKLLAVLYRLFIKR